MLNNYSQSSSLEEMQMLTFSLDDVLYGVNVQQVREVRNFEGVTPVPYAPEYVKGVTNLRGEVIPVIDLRKRFGMVSKSSESGCFMIIIQDKHPVGITVDAVMEVLTVSRKDIEANPGSIIVDKSESVLGVAKHDKDLIVLLDFLKIVSKDIMNIKEDSRGFKVESQDQQKAQAGRL